MLLQALDALLEVSSSYEQSCSRSDYSMFFKEDSRHPFEQSDAVSILFVFLNV